MALSTIVLVGQSPAILGLDGISPVFTQQALEIMRKIGQTKATTLGIGISSIAVLFIIQFAGKKWGHKHPLIRYFYTTRNLFVIGLFTIISFLFNHTLRQPIWKVTGEIPRGIQPAAFPNQKLLTDLLSSTINIALIIALEHVALARSFARNNGYKIDNSQELMYLGVINLITAVLGGTPVGGGDFARAAVNQGSGVRSPLGGIATSGVVLLSIFAVPGLLRWTPAATIAAVVFVAVIEAMPPVKDMGKYWRLSFADFIAALLCLNITLIATSLFGIGAGVAAMIFYTIFRTMFTHPTRLTNLDLEKQHDAGFPSWWAQSDSIPDGTQVIEISGDLMYLNASRAKSRILDTIYTYHYGIPPSPADLSKRPWSFCEMKHTALLRKKAGLHRTEASHLRVIVLDLTAMSFIDTHGIDVLAAIKSEVRAFAGQNVELRFVGICDKVMRRFQRYRWILRNPFDQQTEEYPSDEVELVVKKEKEKDLVFSHLALAIQFQNRSSGIGRFDFQFDMKS